MVFRDHLKVNPKKSCKVFVFIDKTLETGSWLDLGLFLQSFFLAARAFDLHTCPQASMAEYPDVVRSHLNVNSQFYLACGRYVNQML